MSAHCLMSDCFEPTDDDMGLFCRMCLSRVPSNIYKGIKRRYDPTATKQSTEFMELCRHAIMQLMGKKYNLQEPKKKKKGRKNERRGKNQ